MFVKFWRSFAECKWWFTCRPDLHLFPALYFKCVRSVRTHKIYSLTSHVSGLKEQFCLLGNGIISVLYHNVLSYDGLLFHLLPVGGVSCVTCSLGSGWKHSPVPVISPMTWSCTSPRLPHLWEKGCCPLQDTAGEPFGACGLDRAHASSWFHQVSVCDVTSES